MRTLTILLILVATACLAVAQTPITAAGGSMMFDVRNGDQKGKLMIGDTELVFESLTDAKHSRRWKYAEVRELSKKGKKDFRVRPMKGSTYDFQLPKQQERDKIYDLISTRLIAARGTAK